jgi:hypothetical protein
MKIAPAWPKHRWATFSIGTLALGLVFLAGASGGGQVTFFNTGVDQFGAPIQDGEIDAHYTLAFTDPFKYRDPTQPMSKAAAVGAAAGWLGWHGVTSRLSRWISVPSAEPPSYAAPGFYQFRTIFTLTGVDLSTFRLNGRFASDNATVGIYLNGHVMSLQNVPGYEDWTPLTVGPSSYFAASNTLDFVVQNLLTTPNPMGLRVEFTGSAARPESEFLVGLAAAFLVGAAAAVLFVFRRSRA